MKKLILTNRIIEIVIAVLLSAIFLLALPSCKSVKKIQSATTETATVNKSDSSKTQTVTYIDTTKTDSSTEITTTIIKADSVEINGNIAIGAHRMNDVTTGSFSNPIGQSRIKAKGVIISITNKKQAAIQNKGITAKTETKQNDIKTDSNFTKSEVVKTIDKKPSIKTGIGLIFGFALLAGLIWLIIWVWRRKKAIIEKVL